jgi:hypothetical protein
MQTCRLLHTGLEEQYNGFIINGYAYIKEADIDEEWAQKAYGENYQSVVVDGDHYYPPVLFGYFETECDNHLIQLEVDGKWGYADTISGKIVIPPEWDWADPFYGEYALVRTGCPLKPGETDRWELPEEARCGYINTRGEIIVPLNYCCDAETGASRWGFFAVREPGGLFGVVGTHENIIIPFEWPNYSYDTLYSLGDFCKIRRLDVMPQRSNKEEQKVCDQVRKLGFTAPDRYFIINHNGKYGVIAEGRLLQEPTLPFQDLWEIIKTDWENNPPPSVMTTTYGLIDH